MLNTVRRYNPAVPVFLRERPKFFVEHCLRRIPPAVTAIPRANIEPSADGRTYVVHSVDSDKSYVVCLSSDVNPDIPSCSCYDWCRYFLPCKHMLAVVMFSSNTWSSLPAQYTTFPMFTVDSAVAGCEAVSEPAAEHASDSAVAGCEAVSEPAAEHASDSAVAGCEAVSEPAAEHASDTVSTDDGNQLSPAAAPSTAPDQEPTERLQARLRNLLQQASQCTYSMCQQELLQQSVQEVKDMLGLFKARMDPGQQRAVFRRNRRTVRSSIAGVGLRRRLAVLRARRRQKKKQRKLHVPVSTCVYQAWVNYNCNCNAVVINYN